MKFLGSILLLVLTAVGFAQQPVYERSQALAPIAPPMPLTSPGPFVDGSNPACLPPNLEGNARGRLSGNHNFDNFIGFMSNPVFNIDPRAVTELWPLFGSTWTSSIPALPSANIWIPGGAGINVALSERLSFGVNQGGYMVANFSRSQPGLFVDHLGHLRNRLDFAGGRDGWLNLGVFGQYTLIQDVPDQFLVTGGLRVVAPIGSSAIFQGSGPAVLAPYLTAGKEIGDCHVLATAGYQFAAGSGGAPSFFYGCVHLDWRTFGWLYPLVEFNGIYHVSHVDIDLPTRFDFIDFGDFDSTGNLVTLAAGANAVLCPGKLELGAVYETSIATQRNFSFNGFLVKMVYRY
jgi:hypothetical protein